MANTKVFYRIINAGDGSAYINFYSCERLANWLESQDAEGFAESTVDSLETTGEIVGERIITPLSYLCEEIVAWELDPSNFVAEVFPGGVPPVTAVPDESPEDYCYHVVHCRGVQVARVWAERTRDIAAEVNVITS